MTGLPPLKILSRIYTAPSTWMRLLRKRKYESSRSDLIIAVNNRNRCLDLVFFILLHSALFSCHNPAGPTDEKDTVKTPAQMDEQVGGDLKKMLQLATEKGDKLNDTTSLNYRKLLDSLYERNNYTPLWSNKERWRSPADSLFSFIENAKDYGLFPSDYHYTSLAFIHRVLLEDTISRKSAAIWARADLLFTDAFFTLVKHLKQGRLNYDSVTLRKDTLLPEDLYARTLTTALQFHTISATLQSLEPRNSRVDSPKAYIKDFLATAPFPNLTLLAYPTKDSLPFYRLLTQRMQEVGYIDSAATVADTSVLFNAVLNYQQANGIKLTGKISQDLVDRIVNSDWEKFKRIAINLDRYKLLPDSLPATYVWVNLPSFTLQVIHSDTVVFESKLIVGAPKTRTPLLTTQISTLLTFPQFTSPNTIIFTSNLPRIKENVDYL